MISSITEVTEVLSYIQLPLPHSSTAILGRFLKVILTFPANNAAVSEENRFFTFSKPMISLDDSLTKTPRSSLSFNFSLFTFGGSNDFFGKNLLLFERFQFFFELSFRFFSKIPTAAKQNLKSLINSCSPVTQVYFIRSLIAIKTTYKSFFYENSFFEGFEIIFILKTWAKLVNWIKHLKTFRKEYRH